MRSVRLVANLDGLHRMLTAEHAGWPCVAEVLRRGGSSTAKSAGARNRGAATAV